MSDRDVRKAMRALRAKIDERWDVETLPFGKRNIPVRVRDDVWLYVPPKNNRLVAGMRGYDGDILNMTISSGNRGAAGRLLISPKGERLLCHKGHLGGNRTPVRMEDFLSEVEGHRLVEAEMEDLAVVANLDSPRVLSNVSHFVRECARIRTVADFEPAAARKARTGFNPGAKDPQERRSTRTQARHFDAATALKAATENLGWTVARRAMKVSPDLLVEKGKRSALFEVKPDGQLASFMTAIGELLTYSVDLRPDVRIVAARVPSAASRDLVIRALEEHDIRFCAIGDDGTVPPEGVKAALK